MTIQDSQARENRSSAASRSDLKVMANDIAYMRQDVLDIKQNLMSTYVTKDQFDPVKKLVYGLVGLILTAVVVALLTFVLGNHQSPTIIAPTTGVNTK